MAPAAPEAAVAAVDAEIDPLDEANIHMMGGRDAQATSILNDAIAKDPGREELQVKLLEIDALRKDKAAFAAHWDKILKATQNINRTIVAGGQVAGYIACFPLEGHLEVTYWLGREFWGRGLATQALQRLLQLVVERPIYARAATDNLGSIRVLQKCGFKIIGNDKGFAHGRGEETEEYILRLDRDPAIA